MDTLTPRQQFCLAQREKRMPILMDSVVSFRSSHRDIGTLPWLSVGKNNFINETVVFAHDGFGYEKIDGKWLLIPHTGRIRIGEDVHIHAFTVVCPGTGDNDETVIGDGTKIDTRCHIAHNVKIGKNCLITSGVTIGGSAEIGDDVYIGIGALIRNKIKIGKGAIIGMGAVVVTDVPEGITVVGNPAKPI